MTIQSIGATGNVPSWTMADRLRKARETAGLKQVELADMIGVSAKTINRYEDGASVRRPVVLSWALATGVPLEWIQTGGLNDESPSPDGDGLSESCTPRDLNPEPTDIRSLIARRSARSIQTTRDKDAA